MGLRERKNVDLIACPSCGRAEIDVIDVARRAQEAFGDKEIPLQVAVMGCVVNGPGEAATPTSASPPARRRATCSCGARTWPSCPRTRWSTRWSSGPRFIGDNGVDAALERARSTSDAARRRPSATAELLGEQGADANHSEQRAELIRKF